MQQYRTPDDFLSHEEKLLFAHQLKALPEEQLTQVLNELATNGWLGTLNNFPSIFPSGKNYLLHCAFPPPQGHQNPLYASVKLVCGDLLHGPHVFCMHHNISSCPIDNSPLVQKSMP